MDKIKNIKPERVMHYFKEISQIPRCSYDEERISDYLAKTGKDLGLEVIQDEALNIIIRKPAYKGYENAPTVVLQGHMDMVCEKSDNSNHDFTKDPIKFEIEDDFLIAKETTLGADNGIAVAMSLAILESKENPHPALEVLITSNEESGMTGAAALDPKDIKGKILINIDSEEEGTILVSCAGGERNIITIPVIWEEMNKDKVNYDLTVAGLMGGHSGLEIDQGRGNSNKIIGRVLNRIDYLGDIDISNIEGGSKSNAIPRLSKVVLSIAKDKIEDVKEEILKVEKELKLELMAIDKNVELVFEKSTKEINKVFNKSTKEKIIRALMLLPNGVQTMSKDIEGLVESSNNVGVVKTLDDSITIECAMRSSVGSLKNYISEGVKLISDIIGAQWESRSSYPAWEYSKESYIRDVFIKAYKDINDKEVKIAAIHAGLECGLFDEKFEDMDMVSFGPDMFGVHAPGEKLSLSSTEKSYDLLLKVLKEIK